MARIRTIKPEFFTSESIIELEPLARLFFISLWCEADRDGRLAWKPKTLKYRYLPADDCDIEELGEQLIAQDLICLYEIDGEQYCQVSGFNKHQVVNNRERESEIPEPSDACMTRESGVKAEGKEGRKGKEGKGREVVPVPYLEVAKAYNEHFAEVTGNASVNLETLSNKRKTAIKKMWNLNKNKNSDSVGYWITYFKHCATFENMQFGAPRSDRFKNWNPSFDFLMREDTLDKARENNL